MPSLILTPYARALFHAAGAWGKVYALIFTNLEYAHYVEYGTTKMEAQPVIEPYLAEYQGIVTEELVEAFKKYPNDPLKAVDAGVKFAALRIMALMADRLPVDSGRLKGSYGVILPDGRQVMAGRQITAEQARLIRLANAKKKRKKAAIERRKAKRAADRADRAARLAARKGAP